MTGLEFSTSSAPVVIPHISERERRFAVAYTEAAMELGRDDQDTAVLAYFRAVPRADITERQAKGVAAFLTRRVAVKDLVNHLRRELSMRAMVPASRVVEELERCAFINPLDYGRIDDKGQLHVDLSRTTHRQMSGIVEFEVKERVIKVKKIKVPGETEDEDDEELETVVERKTKVKFAKMDALDKLSRVHGLYVEGMQDPGTSVQALDRAIAKTAAKLGVTLDNNGQVVPS